MKKYRINLARYLDRLKHGESIFFNTGAFRLDPDMVEAHGMDPLEFFDCVDANHDPDHWPQALLEEIEEELDPRYIFEGAPVEVSNDKEEWVKGHWVPHVESKLVYLRTFCGGQTSHTTDGRIAYWDHWRIPESMDPDEWKAKWYKPPSDPSDESIEGAARALERGLRLDQPTGDEFQRNL